MNNKQESMIYGVFSAAIIYLILFGCGGIMTQPVKETYILAPKPITAKAAEGNAKSLADLPHKLECAPSAKEGGAYYSKSLSPGGICGDQAFVNKVMHGYSIEDGIGRNLLD